MECANLLNDSSERRSRSSRISRCFLILKTSRVMCTLERLPMGPAGDILLKQTLKRFNSGTANDCKGLGLGVYQEHEGTSLPRSDPTLEILTRPSQLR